MELEELKFLIRQAFKDVKYPGDNNIAGCSRSLTPIGCDDCDVLAAHFKGTTWQEHTPQSLIGCDSAPTFLYPEALHYYVPAFLLADLDDPSGDYGPNLYDSIVWNHWLGDNSFGDNGYHQAEAKKYINLLSVPQRQAIIKYFKYCSTFEGDYEPGERTLEIIDFLQS